MRSTWNLMMNALAIFSRFVIFPPIRSGARLITSKSPKLEDEQTIIERIHEAAQIVDIDRLYLSPQCGFASCEIGNKLTEEEQWAKLKLVKEIAEEVWGK